MAECTSVPCVVFCAVLLSIEIIKPVVVCKYLSAARPMDQEMIRRCMYETIYLFNKFSHKKAY